MFGGSPLSALAVELEDAITSAAPAKRSVRSLPKFLTDTVPVRRGACDSCVAFHGDAPATGHSRARWRGRRSGGQAPLAVGPHRLGAPVHDLDAARGGGAGGSPENCNRGRSWGRRG